MTTRKKPRAETRNPKFGLGWTGDRPDPRDWHKAVMPRADLPSVVDLRAYCPPIYNQGSLGSCTAQAVCALAQFTELEEKKVGRLPSRLYVYYNTRVLQRTVNEDSGASIRNAVKALAKDGYCIASKHRDDNSRFRQRPSADAYADGRPRALPSKGYFRVEQSLQAIKSELADRNPVVFGMTVFESFMSRKTRDTGIVPMPRSDEEEVGGHAMLIVGYSDERRAFLVRNSWGTGWGIKGYCWIPYEMLTNRGIASDFWTINDVA